MSLTPPDEPLDDAARARIRRDVLAGLDGPRRSARRWLVPVAAAAAVVVIAGGAAVLAGNGDDTAAPATSDTPSATPSATDTTSEVQTSTPTSTPTETTVAPATTPADRRCAGEIGALHRADEVVRHDGDGGTVTIDVSGDRWQLCGIHGDKVTLHRPASLDPSAGLDSVAPYRVSEDVLSIGKAGFRSDFLAAGLVPDGTRDFQVTYTFPGGETATADQVDDEAGRTWWILDHTVTDGPLAQPGVNETTLDPISVEISQRSGSQTLHVTFSLDWGLDTCAQVNHGC